MNDSVASSKMQCPYCGKEINQDSFACQYCGRAVLKTSSSNQKERGQQEQQALHQVTANTIQAKPEAKDETPASKPLPVIGKCRKCGLEKKGRTYKYFYGRKMGQKTSYSTSAGATTRITETTVSVGGSNTMFLCDSCVQRSTLKSRIKMLLVTLLTGGFLMSGVVSFFEKGIVSGFFCLIPYLIIISALGYFVFRKIESNDGEDLAGSWAVSNGIHGSGIDRYWTTETNSKMKKL